MIAVNRRKFLGAGAGGMGLLGLAGAMPAWARGADILAGNARKGLDEVSGPNIDLTVARSAFATGNRRGVGATFRSEEHTSELQSLMRSSYAVFCLKKKKLTQHTK